MATRTPRMLMLVAALSVLFLAALDCPADPSFKVTVGSEFSLAAADLGLTAFAGKTRVFLRNGRRIVTVPAKVVRSGDSAGKVLNCTWKAKLAPGRYALLVETDDANGTKVVLTATEYLVVAPPAIHGISSCLANAGDQLTLSGAYFSPRCTVWMGLPGNTMFRCQVLTKPSEIMDPLTAQSELVLTVPNKLESVAGALVKVVNPIDSDTESIDADLAASEATVYTLTVSDLHETSKYLSTLADFITRFKAEHLGMTLALSAGDLLTAYPKTAFDPVWARDLYTADPETHGVAMMEQLAAMPFDAVAPGNHDPCLGLARLLELHGTYPVPFQATNLFRFQDGGYTPWNNLTDPPLPTSRSFQLKGIDVGVVAAASTVQDHWTDADKSEFRVLNSLDERTMEMLRECALRNDIVILITHQDDVSDIIPVYGADPQPTGEYRPNCDIYTLKDLANVALILGGHEHKNYFRRASYAGDNTEYALYTDPIYNPTSKLVLVKSSKFYGEYAGVVKILWDKADRTVDTVQLIEGNRDGDGKYLGCADDQMAVVDDGGLIQELAEDPWDPLVDSRWWKMEDWITANKSPSPRQKLRPPLTK